MHKSRCVLGRSLRQHVSPPKLPDEFLRNLVLEDYTKTLYVKFILVQTRLLEFTDMDYTRAHM